MSKIKNSALDQYGAELFEQQQFETAGVEGVKMVTQHQLRKLPSPKAHSALSLN